MMMGLSFSVSFCRRRLEEDWRCGAYRGEKQGTKRWSPKRVRVQDSIGIRIGIGMGCTAVPSPPHISVSFLIARAADFGFLGHRICIASHHGMEWNECNLGKMIVGSLGKGSPVRDRAGESWRQRKRWKWYLILIAMTLADCNLDGASILVFTLMHLQLLNVTRGTPPHPPTSPLPSDQITIRCLRWPARPLCDIAVPWPLGPSFGLFLIHRTTQLLVCIQLE